MLTLLQGKLLNILFMGKKMQNKQEKSYKEIFVRAFYIFIITTIIFIISSIISYPRPHHHYNRRNACYSNIRVIQGAVEMYNMDSNSMMKELNLDLLQEGKYLKEKPFPPEEECNYSNKGDLSENGEVYCALHGGMTTEGDEEVINKKANEKNKENITLVFILLFIFSIPSLIYLFFALLKKLASSPSQSSTLQNLKTEENNK